MEVFVIGLHFVEFDYHVYSSALFICQCFALSPLVCIACFLVSKEPILDWLKPSAIKLGHKNKLLYPLPDPAKQKYLWARGILFFLINLYFDQCRQIGNNY